MTGRLIALAGIALYLAACTTDDARPAPSVQSRSPSAAPSASLPAPTAAVLVPAFTGRGEQPIPVFTSARYTVVITCVGGGPVHLYDTAGKDQAPPGSTCDGGVSTTMIAAAKATPQRLRISAGPSSDWQARVETG